MKKKILAMVLAVCTVLTTVGCGAEQKEVTTKTSETETVVKNETVETSTVETSTVENEEPVTITVVAWDRGDLPAEYGTPTDNKWVKIYQEKVLEELNIDLQYVAIPRSNADEKLQALIAAGDEPDIFYTYEDEFFIEWSNIGVAADLTEYMDTEAGKEIAEKVGEDVMVAGQISGAQYSIVCPRYMLSWSNCLIRKDWFDTVGVELEEVNGHYAIRPSVLKEALIKIKNEGLCDYPFGLITEDSSIDPILGAFITDVTDEMLITGLEQTEGYKEGMSFLNECYNEGLINPDFPLYDSNNLGEMIGSSNVAFWAEACWTHTKQMEALYEVEPSAEYICVELVHEDGTPANYRKYSPIGAYGLVSSNCENTEKAVELINWFLSEEAHIIGCHGIEGEHWEYDADGDFANIDKEYNSADRKRVTDMNVYLNSDPCNKIGHERFYRKQKAGSMLEKTIDQMIIGMDYISIGEGKYMEPVINVFIQASVDYAAELSENKTNLQVGSITAKADKFDQVFDENLKVYLEEGGSQVAEEKLEAWNAQK